MVPEPTAFVVWVDCADPESGAVALRGRVEHVQSSERARFESADELLRFLLAQLPKRPGTQRED
jgi:ethanolamine utilization microcompartment shell protein EutS